MDYLFSPDLSDADATESTLSTAKANFSDPHSLRLSNAAQFSSDESDKPPQKKNSWVSSSWPN